MLSHDSTTMEESEAASGTFQVEIGTDLDDRDWDQFLENERQGQFQQASMWGQAKAVGGWGVRRLKLREGGKTRAGFQILEKRTRLGTIGFINKGPVVAGDNEALWKVLVRALSDLHAQVGYRAVLAHTPDAGGASVSHLNSIGFIPERFGSLTTATLMVDASAGWEAVQSGFRRTVRRLMRQAVERGVSIEEGTEKDAREFHGLMASTAARQGVPPNPATADETVTLVKSFAQRGRARIWFGVYNGKRIAGGLALLFGDRVNFWKKGWDQSASDTHANVLVTADIIRWACERGFRWLDFAAMDRDTAEAMNAGRSLPPDIANRRDFFNLGFGGKAFLFPPCLIRFGNPLFKIGYRSLASDPVRKWILRLARKSGSPG